MPHPDHDTLNNTLFITIPLHYSYYYGYVWYYILLQKCRVLNAISSKKSVN